ncbi:hypothetical protein V1519DRAFT_457095 [Lipomyces tetrasporus]
MPAALAIATIALLNIPISPDLTITDPRLRVRGVAVLFSLIFFIALYAIALEIVPWQCNVIFPMEVRARGTMMLTLTNWSLNAVISSRYIEDGKRSSDFQHRLRKIVYV